MDTQLPRSFPAFVWHFLRPYKVAVVSLISLAVLAGLWGPFNSILVKHIINLLPEVQNENTAVLVWPAIMIVLNFIVFDNITWRSIGYINYKFQPTIKNQIIATMFDYSLSNSHEYFQNNLSGRISSQITTLADNIENILHIITPEFIRGASLLIASFIAAAYVNLMFFYTLIIWFVAFSAFSLFMSKRLVILADTHASSESLLSGQLVDGIANNSNVRIFSRREYEMSRLNTFFSQIKNAFQRQEAFIILLCCVQGFLIALMMACASYFLVRLYGKGMISVGDFALIFGLSMQLGHMMWFTMARVDEFNQALGKCKQSLNALIIETEIKDCENARVLTANKGKVAFENVTFHYKNAKPIFKNKSLTIHAGEKVGLVGYSGGGKTTFVNLVLRLYDVQDGHILIDDQDVREVSQDSLRSQLAMIPQDPALFHRSIMENIRYGKVTASDDEVIHAAKKAHAHEFISKLPQSYQSLVGERGVKLSGGQRQRIAIARAILKDAPILLLDEATSQLDSVTESEIQESLWTLMQDKTTIVVAHRLSTLLHMDRILVFDHGSIVEDGNHDELLAMGGLYKTLWDAQVGGFLQDQKSNNL